MEKNGLSGFIRFIFWTLIVGSFGWTTFAFITCLSIHSAHCKEAQAEQEALKSIMIARDEMMIKENSSKFETILIALTDLKADIKYIKENQINRKDQTKANERKAGN